MPRPLHLFSLLFLVGALILLIIVSVSLPYLPATDFTRVHLRTSSLSNSISQIRFGIWAFCVDSSSSHTRTCSEGGHGYAAQFSTTSGSSFVIGSSWTRGLAIHVVAAIVTAVALLATIPKRIAGNAGHLITLSIATFLTFIAFLCDIALFAYTRDKFNSAVGNGSSRTITGPGFWITFAALILLFFSFGSLLSYRRQQKYQSDAYGATPSGSFWRRFRGNRF